MKIVVMDDTNKSNDWQAWYEKNKNLIPEHYKESLENSLAVLQFLSNTYAKVMEQLSPALNELMYKQYPVIKAEKRPVVAEYIGKFIRSVGAKMMFRLKSVVDDEKGSVNFREKYPKFEQWLEVYGKPQQPKLLTDSDKKKLKGEKMNDEEWTKYKSEQNKKLLQFFNWKEKRKTEFIDILQPILFENYKELEKLSADGLILYAVNIYTEYDYYLLVCEHIELFIDCGFPEEDINLTDKKFNENYEKLSSGIKAKVKELRERRIAGESI